MTVPAGDDPDLRAEQLLDKCDAENIDLESAEGKRLLSEESTIVANTVRAMREGLRVDQPFSVPGFEIRCLLGEGGMGRVYLASQRKPQRDVAMKVMNSGGIQARFEQESNTLARLAHPNIVSVYEVGNHQDEDFLVMQFVDGPSLWGFVQENGPLGNKLAATIVMTIADALSHTHRAGVIHRDVKPSNILLNQQHEPFLSDFGLAKTYDSSASLTITGEVMGSPQFMSPEQMSNDTVTGQSDIYSLGAVLYFLLVGHPPFDSPMPSLATRIFDEEPRAPSKIRMGIHQDLETITIKCLAKEQKHRYLTAEELRDDLRRYLDGKAIHAKPDSLARKTIRWANRNRLAASLITIVFATFLGITIASTFASQYQASLRRNADQSAKDAKAILAFFEETVLTAPSPVGFDGGLGDTVTMLSAVDDAAKQLEGKFEDRPLIKASIHSTLAETYNRLGKYVHARDQLQRSADIYSKQLGPNAIETLTARNAIAFKSCQLNQEEEAKAICEDLLRRLAKEHHGQHHMERLDVRNVLAMAYGGMNEPEKQLKLLEDSYRDGKQFLGHDHLTTIKTGHDLALALQVNGRLEDSRELAQECLMYMKSSLGDVHPITLQCRANISNINYDLGEQKEAMEQRREVVKLCQQQLGDFHPQTMAVVCNLARSHADMLNHEQLGELLPLLERGYSYALDNWGETVSIILAFKQSLAVAYSRSGNEEKALRFQREIVELLVSKYGEASTETWEGRTTLAVMLREQARPEEAVPIFQSVYDYSLNNFGADHKRTKQAATDLWAAKTEANSKSVISAVFGSAEIAQGLTTAAKKFNLDVQRKISGQNAGEPGE